MTVSLTPTKTATPLLPRQVTRPTKPPQSTANSPTPSTTSPSEDLLYGALVYKKISALSDKASSRFLTLIDKYFKPISRYATPVYDAIENVLRALTREGHLTSTERTSIKLYSLGRADIDKNPENLSTTHTLDEIKSTTPSLRTWTQSKLEKFRTFRKTFRMKTPTPKQNSSPTPTSLSNTGFLWKPISDTTGNLVILLPHSFTGLAEKVDLLDPTMNHIIESGNFSGIGNGDRLHFRFDKPGEKYPSGTIVRVTMLDGTTKTFKVPNTEKRSA